MTTPSLFTSYMAMISHVIIKINQFTKNPTNITPFKFFIFFSSHNQVFIKMFFHHSPTIIILFKNTLNKCNHCTFTSVKYNIFTEFIINTNNLISKTTRNMVLIFSCVLKSNHYQYPHHEVLTNTQIQHKV